MDATYRQRRALVARLPEDRPWCEVCQQLRATENPDALVLPSHDVHEVLRRSAGGDILDPANCLVVCRPHHDRIHRSPTWAMERGFLKSRYGRDGV
jgi:hypothetical protein